MKYLVLAVAALCIASCQDEEIISSGTVEEGTLVTAKMQFSAPLQEKVTNSRSVNDDEVDDLYILVFNGGKCVWGKYFDSNLSSGSGSVLLQEIPAGNAATIYAVANTNSDVYCINQRGDIKTYLDDIVSAGANESEISGLVVSIMSEARNLTRVGGNWLMAGKLTSVQINKEHNNIGPVILQRLDSEISFEFKFAGNCTSFTAKRWYTVNAPATSRLVKGEDASDNASDFYSTYKKEEGERNPVYDNKFSFYIPENRKSAKNSITTYEEREKEVKGADGKNTIDEATQKRSYVNAPDNGTYVVVTGHFEGYATEGSTGTTTGRQPVTAEVQYIIHMGYLNKIATDFFTNRNTKYKYIVTVSGVDKIVVEVEDHSLEPQPGATGDVVFGGGDNIYKLDAHYENVLLDFDIQKLAAACTTVDGGIVSDEILSSMFMAVTSTPYTKYVNEADESDQKWVEVALNPSGSRDFLLYYTCKKENSLQSVQAMLNELKTAVVNYINTKQIEAPFDANGKAIYSCFVNEFYYEDTDLPNGVSSNTLGTVNIWKTFVNQPDRKMYIVCRRDKSKDEESSVISAEYVLSQRSIQTFYSTDIRPGEGRTVAYGMETVNETGRLGIGTQQRYTGNDNGDGWANTKTAIADGNLLPKWDDCVNSSKNGYTTVSMNQKLVADVQNMTNLNYSMTEAGKTTLQVALKNTTIPYACLIRNRYESGEGGQMSDRDLKWYLPAVYQYQAFYLGEQALSQESRLFTYPEINYNEDNYMMQGRHSKIGKKFYRHYISSTYRDPNASGVYLYWAEEGTTACTVMERDNFQYTPGSWEYDYEPQVFHYRCVRTLGGGEPSTKYDNYTSVDETKQNPVITVGLLNNLSKDRSLVTNGELGVHNYRSDENKFYKNGFEVSGELTLDEFDYITVTNGNKACETLNKNLHSGESKWRSPNLREMTLMWEYKLYNTMAPFTDEGRYAISRTQMMYKRFSNRQEEMPYRYGWGIGVTKSSKAINIGMNSDKDTKGYVRCVRDLK